MVIIMFKKYIETGRIAAAHGIAGEVKVKPWADSPGDLLKYKQFYTEDGILTVEKARVHKEMALIKFTGCDTPEQAVLMRGKILSVDRADIELKEGRFLIQDLIGLDVIDSTGQSRGALTEVLQSGANDVYVITARDGRVTLIPVIPDVVIDILPESGIIRINENALEGLFD